MWPHYEEKNRPEPEEFCYFFLSIIELLSNKSKNDVNPTAFTDVANAACLTQLAEPGLKMEM
jgi:hypothetical protein